MRVKEFFAFIRERHAIWERRKAGQPKPWTKDPILQSYRFCNVYRELDKETIAIDRLWRQPHRDDRHLWFAMVVARLINWSPTLERLGYPVPFRPAAFQAKLERLQDEGGKVFGNAYIVSTNGQPVAKPEYLTDYVLRPLWKERERLAPVAGESLRSFATRLLPFNGMGTFLTAQVVADMKYVEPLRRADDWSTFAFSGPGSRRGLNRVVGRELRAPWREEVWHSTLMELKNLIDPLVDKAGMPPIHAQDLQNCLCEFDKMERVRLGEGRPKARYPGKEN